MLEWRLGIRKESVWGRVEGAWEATEVPLKWDLARGGYQEEWTGQGA